MYYKIQPEQIEIHNFSSPSGDINFFIGSNYVNANLSRSLNGNFDFIGDLSISGVKLKHFYNSTNSLNGSNSFIFGGSDNNVSGQRNSSLNTQECEIGGEGNSIINSKFSSIFENSLENTILGGKFANILQNITGSMILKDSSVLQVEGNINNSLSIFFNGGNFIKRGGLTIEHGDLKVNEYGSGLFSGNLNILGDSYFSNRPTVNGTGVFLQGEEVEPTSLVYITGNQTISGLKGFTTRPTVNGTGVFLQGEEVEPTSLVYITGNQTISGIKNFDVRPTVNGTGVLLIGEAAGGGGTIDTTNLVNTTGNQTISGLKTFYERPQVNGFPVLVSGDGTNGGTLDPTNLVTTNTTQIIDGTKFFRGGIDIQTWDGPLTISKNYGSFGQVIIEPAELVVPLIYTLPDVSEDADFVMSAGDQDIGGLKNFTTRPKVGGVNVALTSELGGVGDTTDLVTTGTVQTIGATKTFAANQIFQGATNQLTFRTGAAGFKINITAPNIPADRTYTIPNVGGNATFIMSTGTQDIAGVKDFTIRPTVKGTGVLLQGEASTGDATLGTIQTFTAQKTFQGALILQKSPNPLTFRAGVDGNVININVPTINNDRTYTIPDVGGDGSFVMSIGDQGIAGTKTFSNNTIFSARVGMGGTNNPIYTLQLGVNSAAKPTSTVWTVASDERLKENIQLADLNVCYDVIKNIPLKRYKWKDEVYSEEQVSDRNKIGWIAQDISGVFPKAVGKHKFTYNQIKDEDGNIISEDSIDDCLSIDADQIYSAMFGATKKLINDVESLKSRIIELEAQISQS